MAVSCDPQSLLAQANCYQCLSAGEQQLVRLALLCNIVQGNIVSCDPQSLLAQGQCFQCVTPGMWPLLELALLCNLASGAGGSANGQILTYTADPTVEGLTPTNQNSPALAYGAGGGVTDLGMEHDHARLAIAPRWWVLMFLAAALWVLIAAAPDFANFDKAQFATSNNLVTIYAVRTNQAFGDLITNDFVLNRYYTNDNRRAWVAVSITNDSGGNSPAAVGLMVDYDQDGIFEHAGLVVQNSGGGKPSVHELSTYLSPLSRFVFTNIGIGTSTVARGSSVWMRL